MPDWPWTIYAGVITYGLAITCIIISGWFHHKGSRILDEQFQMLTRSFITKENLLDSLRFRESQRKFAKYNRIFNFWSNLSIILVIVFGVFWILIPFIPTNPG